MLAVTEVIIHLALQSGLDHHLGQPAQQAPFPGQLRPPARARSTSGRSSCSSEPSAGSAVTSIVATVTGASPVSGVTPLRLQSPLQAPLLRCGRGGWLSRYVSLMW